MTFLDSGENLQTIHFMPSISAWQLSVRRVIFSSLFSHVSGTYVHGLCLCGGDMMGRKVEKEIFHIYLYVQVVVVACLHVHSKQVGRFNE